MLAVVLLAQGRADEALAEASVETAEWSRLWALAVIEWALGKPDASDEALAQLELRHGDSAAYQVAQARAFRGEIDAAFEWLERAYETRDVGVALVGTTVLLEPLHGDPRWTKYLQRIGLAS